MIKQRSTVKDQTVTISETDALWISLTLSAEISRRRRFQPNPLPVPQELIDLEAEFHFISDNQPCIVCSQPTLRELTLPTEGTPEDGPGSYGYPCCSNACDLKFHQAEEASRSETYGDW